MNKKVALFLSTLLLLATTRADDQANVPTLCAAYIELPSTLSEYRPAR